MSHNLYVVIQCHITCTSSYNITQPVRPHKISHNLYVLVQYHITCTSSYNITKISTYKIIDIAIVVQMWGNALKIYVHICLGWNSIIKMAAKHFSMKLIHIRRYYCSNSKRWRRNRRHQFAYIDNRVQSALQLINSFVLGLYCFRRT